MNKNFIRIAATLSLVVLLAVPAFAQRGSANFTRYVVIGDSYGAGVESGSLNERHQIYSWPAWVARQTGAPDFQMPLVSYPGIGAELVLNDVVRFPPLILPAAGSGAPINLNLARPYNNLAIPGANVTDVTTITGRENPPRGTAQQYAQFILRGLGTPVDQAIAQNPTFVTVWIGGNDLLGAVLSGTPAALTPTATFRTSYNAMLDRLIAGAPNAGIVVGNLPTNPASLPYLTTVPPVIINPATRQPLLGANGQPISLVADLGGGTFGQLPAGSLVVLPAASKIATGYGFPEALKAILPAAAFPDIGKPLADTDVLTPTEIATIQARAVEFNTVITEAAGSRNIPVADIRGLFDRFANGHFFVGPFQFTPAYISGGLFSLDGFHLTDLGYMLFANEYIRAINNAYDTEIPFASITQLFANNGAFFGDSLVSGAPAFQGMSWEMSSEAAAQIRSFGAEPQRGRRLRVTTH